MLFIKVYLYVDVCLKYVIFRMCVGSNNVLQILGQLTESKADEW